MKSSLFGFVVIGVSLTAPATSALAGDAKDDAIKKDREQIQGTWQIVALEINGNKAADADARKSRSSTVLTEPGAFFPKANKSARGPAPLTPREAQNHRLHAD